MELANPIDGLVIAETVEIDVPMEHSHIVGAADKIYVVMAVRVQDNYYHHLYYYRLVPPRNVKKVHFCFPNL